MPEGIPESLEERHEEVREAFVRTLLFNSELFSECATNRRTESVDLLKKLQAGESVFPTFRAEGQKSVMAETDSGFMGDDLPAEIQDFWRPHFVFSTHDYGQVAIHNWSYSVGKVLSASPEIKRRWIDAVADSQELTAQIFQGVALNLDPDCLEPTDFCAGRSIEMAFESNFFRNFAADGGGDHSLAWDGETALRDKVVFKNNVPADLMMHGHAGALSTVIYNLVKNPLIFLQEALCKKFIDAVGDGISLDRNIEKMRAAGRTENDPFRDMLKWQVMKDEGPRWRNHLGEDPLEIVADYVETPDAHIIHLHDNGPGLDFTSLKSKLNAIVSARGIDHLKESGACPPGLAEEIEKWEDSPFYFGQMKGEDLANLTKISSLSGLHGHSGSGLWAMERLVNSTDGIAVIGQGLGGKGGTYFALVFPKKIAEDPASVTADIKARLERGEYLPPADTMAA